MWVDGGQVMMEYAVVCIIHSRWGIRHWYEGTNIAWGFCSCNCQMVAASRPVVKIVTKSRENVSDWVLCKEIWLDVGIGSMKFCFRHSHWFFHVFIIYPHKYFVEHTSFFTTSLFFIHIYISEPKQIFDALWLPYLSNVADHSCFDTTVFFRVLRDKGKAKEKLTYKSIASH